MVGGIWSTVTTIIGYIFHMWSLTDTKLNIKWEKCEEGKGLVYHLG